MEMKYAAETHCSRKISSSIESLTNPERLQKHLQNRKEIQNHSQEHKKYLDYFEDSFLIASAQHYDIKGKAYIETPKK